MVKIKANELDAGDNALVQKLHKEVIHLRQVLNLRKKGKFEEIQQQLVRLQKENNRLKQLADHHEEVERLKLENKFMRIELQKIKPEDSSQMLPEDEDLSYNDSISQNKTQMYELSSMRGRESSEKEKPFNPDMPLKCPLCNCYPPCSHYSGNSDYETSPKRQTSETVSKRLKGNGIQKKKTYIPNLARSREQLEMFDNPYSVNDSPSKFTTSVIESRSGNISS